MPKQTNSKAAHRIPLYLSALQYDLMKRAQIRYTVRTGIAPSFSVIVGWLLEKHGHELFTANLAEEFLDRERRLSSEFSDTVHNLQNEAKGEDRDTRRIAAHADAIAQTAERHREELQSRRQKLSSDGVEDEELGEFDIILKDFSETASEARQLASHCLNTTGEESLALLRANRSRKWVGTKRQK